MTGTVRPRANAGPGTAYLLTYGPVPGRPKGFSSTMTSNLATQAEPLPATRGLMRDRDFLKMFLSEGSAGIGSQVSLLALPLTAIVLLHASALQVGDALCSGHRPLPLVRSARRCLAGAGPAAPGAFVLGHGTGGGARGRARPVGGRPPRRRGPVRGRLPRGPHDNFLRHRLAGVPAVPGGDVPAARGQCPPVAL